MVKNFVKDIDAYCTWLLIKIIGFLLNSMLNSNKQPAILFLTPAKKFNRFTTNADYVKVLSQSSSNTKIMAFSLEKYIPGFIQFIRIVVMARKNHLTIVISSYVPSIYRFPNPKCLREINNKIASVKLIWADTHFEGIEKRILPTLELVSGHIVSDDPLLRFRQNPRLNDLPATFFPFPAFPQKWYEYDLQNCNKTFDVVFSGTLSGGAYHMRRTEYLDFAKAHGILIQGFTSKNYGRLNDVRPSYQEYLNVLKEAKIGLNFSWHSGVGAVNARVWETIVAGAMLLTTDDDVSVQAILKPNKDYVTFSTREDMLDKIKYYLRNSSQRLKIIDSARSRVKFAYSAEKLILLLNKKS